MSGSPRKGSSGSLGSQYRRVCMNKSFNYIADGGNAGEAGMAKTHAFGVYGGRLFFLPAHLGKQSESKSGLDCREKRDGAIIFMRFKDNIGGDPPRGITSEALLYFLGVFCPFFLFFIFSTLFLRYSRLTRLSHALWNFSALPLFLLEA